MLGSKHSCRILVLVIVLLAGVSLAWAMGTAGLLDPSFGSGGVVVTTMNDWGLLRDVAAQSDGKIIAVGEDRFNHGTEYLQWSVHRYDTDGSLDTGFGTNGRVTLFGEDADNRAGGVALDGSGKILVVGNASRVTGSKKKTKISATGAVVRLATDGSLDSTFGTGGTAYALDSAGPVAVQGNGYILIGGSVTVSAKGKRSKAVALARFDANGDLDTSFGDGGIVVNDMTKPSSRVHGSGDDIIKSIGVQSDGKIIVAGRSQPGGLTSDNDQWLARYDTDGSVDTTFGTNGKVLVGVSFERTVARLAIDADDSIVVSGYGFDPDALVFVHRYDADGGLDTSFGVIGEVIYETVDEPLGGALAIQSDGKIVVAVDLTAGTDDDVSVLRLDSDGSLDTTFGIGGEGEAADDGFDRDNGTRAITLDANGGIVIGGWTVGGTTPSWLLVRYGGD